MGSMGSMGSLGSMGSMRSMGSMNSMGCMTSACSIVSTDYNGSAHIRDCSTVFLLVPLIISTRG